MNSSSVNALLCRPPAARAGAVAATGEGLAVVVAVVPVSEARAIEAGAGALRRAAKGGKRRRAAAGVVR